MTTTTLYGRHCKADPLKINLGDKVIFDVIEWFHEGWEFGHPTVMLGPVIAVSHDHGAETLIESVCIDLCCGSSIPWIHPSDEKEFEWRGWNRQTLKRRFREALNGKRFPIANYRATTKTVEFIKDRRGDLDFRYIGEEMRRRLEGAP